MRYILWLEWLHFYTSGEEGPTVAVRDKLVLDANRAARGCEISPGMTLRQAKNLCREVKVIEWKAEDYSGLQVQWLDVCTEFTGIIEPIDQHIAALDLSAHPHRIEIVERLVRKLVATMKLPLLYGAAPSKWIANLAAHQQDMGLAATQPETFLAELPVSCLAPAEEADRRRLAFLGYHRIGDVIAIPDEVLRGQFGDSASIIARAARGGVYEPVRALYPPDSIQDCFLFESGVMDWESIHQAMTALSRRIGSRLQGRQSSTIELWIERDEDGAQHVSRKTTKPIHNHLTLRAALSLLFNEQMEQVASPVAGIRVALRNLVETRYKQVHLVENDTRPEAHAALNYVQNTFGESAVRLGSEIVLPRRERVLREWRRTVGWL